MRLREIELQDNVFVPCNKLKKRKKWLKYLPLWTDSKMHKVNYGTTFLEKIKSQKTWTEHTYSLHHKIDTKIRVTVECSDSRALLKLSTRSTVEVLNIEKIYMIKPSTRVGYNSTFNYYLNKRRALPTIITLSGGLI